MSDFNISTPVYLVTGVLESGKTSFLDFTAKQDYFQIEGTTLLITCEEGEEEMLISRAFVAFFQSCFTQCSEEDSIARYAVRQRELGEMVLTLLQGDVALISNHLGILNSFRSKCIKDRMHFFLALHVPVIRIAIANSCFVINGGFHIHHH